MSRNNYNNYNKVDFSDNIQLQPLQSESKVKFKS